MPFVGGPRDCGPGGPFIWGLNGHGGFVGPGPRFIP